MKAFDWKVLFSYFLSPDVNWMDPSLDRDECEEKDCNFKKIGLLFMSSENAKKVLFFPLDGFI